jgi:hypothetical protein
MYMGFHISPVQHHKFLNATSREPLEVAGKYRSSPAANPLAPRFIESRVETGDFQGRCAPAKRLI